MSWNHICWTYNNASSIIRMVSNGHVIVEKAQESTAIPLEFLGTMVIMRKSFPVSASVQNVNFWPMFGKLTDVNIWDYSMSTEEVDHLR